MSDPFDKDISASQWPKPEDVSFDLDEVLSGILSLRSEIPEDAFTASTLGTERAGHGVLINQDGPTEGNLRGNDVVSIFF